MSEKKSEAKIRENINLYEGREKYIFVSYSHKDWQQVYPVLEMLSDQGYRLWYDQGIHPGNEWPEIVAGKLYECAVFMVFLSENYMKSQNCIREIHFAVAKSKELLSIVLEPVQLSLGVEMQLSVSQAVRKQNYTSEKIFYEHILSADSLKSCKNEVEECDENDVPQNKEANSSEKQNDGAPQDSAEENSGKKKMSKNGKIIGILIAAILVVAVGGVCLYATYWGTSESLMENLTDLVSDEENAVVLDEDLTTVNLDEFMADYEAGELSNLLIKDNADHYLLTDYNANAAVITMPEGFRDTEYSSSAYLLFQDDENQVELYYELAVLGEYNSLENQTVLNEMRDYYMTSEDYSDVKCEENRTVMVNEHEISHTTIAAASGEDQWRAKVFAWVVVDDKVISCSIDMPCEDISQLNEAVEAMLVTAFEGIVD